MNERIGGMVRRSSEDQVGIKNRIGCARKTELTGSKKLNRKRAQNENDRTGNFEKIYRKKRLVGRVNDEVG